MPQVNRNANDRRDVYVSAMEGAGHRAEVLNISESNTWDFERFGFDEATRLLDRLDLLPTRTIVCANDRLAFGVIAAAWKKGIKVGHGTAFDLRVAGHDDHPLSQYACPPITTVAQNYNEIGRLAISLLLRKLGEADTSDDPLTNRDQILLKSELILRASA